MSNSFTYRGVFLLIGVTCSPHWSALNVIRVAAKYHVLFEAKSQPLGWKWQCATSATLTYTHCQAHFINMSHSLVLIHTNTV